MNGVLKNICLISRPYS